MQSHKLRLGVAFAPAVVGLVAMMLHGPIPQDPAYHRFADQRRLFGIPHFGDAVSNVALVLAGALGLSFMVRERRRAIDSPFREDRERPPYFVFFGGTLLTGFGSAYYHLAPDTPRLFWDRLPMTLVFMSLFAIVLGECLTVRLGTRLCVPLLAVGAASVLYWMLTERLGAGDLRPYAVVQYAPALTIPLLLLLFPPRDTESPYFWGVVACYGLAKLCELLDPQILKLTGIVSGHSLKHLLAAAGSWLVLRMLRRRAGSHFTQPLASEASEIPPLDPAP